MTVIHSTGNSCLLFSHLHKETKWSVWVKIAISYPKKLYLHSSTIKE